MSLISILMSAEAAAKQRASRKTAYLHRSVTTRPLVIAAYNLSGEAAAPLGFCYGTDPDAPKVVVAAEPRNRTSRFAAINTFCKDLCAFIAPFLVLSEKELKDGRILNVATAAPQIAVPNRATRDYLGARIGRSLRYLGLGTHPVPETTEWAGAHLSWLAEHAHLPGQSIFLAATELLTRHFATGQSDLEDENLASLLAWIHNPEGSGLEAIAAAEASAFGPVPDPAWEGRLEPKVKKWTEHFRAEDEAGCQRVEGQVRDLVAEALRPAYGATHAALDTARQIPAAPRTPERWGRDLRQWSTYAWRASQGIPRFARRHSPVRAAKMLELWSAAQDRLEYEEAMDDPLVMAEHDGSGRCVYGQVQRVNLENRELKPGNKRKTQVPLLTLELTSPTLLLPGEKVKWVPDDRVAAELRSVSETTVVIALMGGHKSGTRAPAVGTDTVFVALSLFGGSAPDDPKQTPWTHRPPEPEAEARGATAADGSPDLSPEELAALPAGAGTEAGDTPGSIL